MDLYNIIPILWVMGILDKITASKQQIEVVSQEHKLTQQEIQMALLLLKQSTIKGEQVEVFYNLVVKLQNQFIQQGS